MRKDFLIIVIREAGLDGLWIHRVLDQEGIESHIVEPASIMTSRRDAGARRPTGSTVKHWCGVCAILRVPTPEEEDRRRLSR